jgi:hypothetical protein
MLVANGLVQFERHDELPLKHILLLVGWATIGVHGIDDES